MGREATITQSEVNAVAERLHAAGTRPTNRAVRDELGSGSMATIVKHLRVWRAGQMCQSEAPVVLPPALQRALLEFIGQEVASAKAGIESELAITEQANTDLITESERQAAALETQEKEIEGLRAERAVLHGRLAQLSSDFEANQAALETQRQAAEVARTELARHELRLEALPKLTAEIERLQIALEMERTGRVSAEQAAAVAAARLDKTEGQMADLKERLEQTEADARSVTRGSAKGRG